MDTLQMQQVHSLKRIKKKIVRTESHISFLEQCIKKGIVSKGFKLKWCPSYIPSDDKNGFDEILHRTSVELMMEVKGHNLNKLHLLQKREEEVFHDICKVTPVTREQVCGLFDQEIQCLRSKVSKTKHKKLQSLMSGDAAPSSNTLPPLHIDRIKDLLGITTEIPCKVPRQEIPVMNGEEKAEWYRTTVKGDGNCFFRAISYNLFNTEDFHEKIRHSVIDHISQNRE